MQEIRYSRAKLWLLAICSAHVAALMLWLLVNPQYRVTGRFGLLLNGSFGHLLTLPLIGFTCLLVAGRCVIVATGSAAAIVTDADGATIHTIWRSHRIVWRNLLRVRLAATKVRHTTSYSLKFDQLAGGTISLPLAGLTIPQHGQEYQRLLEAISAAHLSAINRLSSDPSHAEVASAHGAVQPAPRIEPVRPAFGRRIG